ncbi:MAG: FAD-dependent oxidoreductase [Thermoflexales bacterium]|nr:FAD-dependent oxidoreductase [Thermoflexales bacterium]
MSQDETNYDAVIIGGGVAGLTAALHLAERGLRPLVLEADPQQAGGRLKGGPPVEFGQAGRTWRFRTEHGVHGIWSPYRNLQAMLARHRIRPVLVPARQEAWIHADRSKVRWAAIGTAVRHSWVPAPFHYLGLFVRPRFLAMLNGQDLLSLPHALAGILVALSIDPLEKDRPRLNFSMAEYCRHWSPKLSEMCLGLTRNAIPASLEQLPALSFIAFLRFYTLRRRDDWAFSYLPDDSGSSVIAPLATALAAHGGELRLGATVVRLERQAELWEVAWEQAPSTTACKQRAPHVILATDAPSTEALLRASPPTAELANGLRLPAGIPTNIVRLWFSRAPCLSYEAGIFTGNSILDNFFWLHRIYNDYIEWGRISGGSAIEAHVYGPPEVLAMPDEALLERAVADVERAWPELKGHLLHAALARNEATHTLLDIGPTQEHLAISTAWPGLLCCGDWVRDRSPALFLERACVSAIKAANAVLAERGKPAWCVLEPPPPEPLASLIEGWMRGLFQALRRLARRA